jgi:hypothetical protein
MSCCKACAGKKKKCSGAGGLEPKPKKRLMGFKQRLPDKKIEPLKMKGSLGGRKESLSLVKAKDKSLNASLAAAQNLVAKHLHPKSIRVAHKNNKGPTDKVIGRI